MRLELSRWPSLFRGNTPCQAISCVSSHTVANSTKAPHLEWIVKHSSNVAGHGDMISEKAGIRWRHQSSEYEKNRGHIPGRGSATMWTGSWSGGVARQPPPIGTLREEREEEKGDENKMMNEVPGCCHHHWSLSGSSLASWQRCSRLAMSRWSVACRGARREDLLMPGNGGRESCQICWQVFFAMDFDC